VKRDFIMFDKLKNAPPADRVMETKTAEPPMSVPTPVAPPAGKSAVIGAGIKINGEISGNENILIEGRVEGRISLSGNDVTIGKTGQVMADVSAKTIRVAGEVSGDLQAKERVVISGSGNVRGNVVAPRVVLEDGAVFKGSIDMDPGEAQAADRVADRSAARAPAKANGSLAASTGSGLGGASGGQAALIAGESGGKVPDLSLKNS
jgi:cytoskeletal protein CcmA (bactofilin family)